VPDVVLCRVDQLVEGRGRPARAGDLYLAVFLVEGRISVIDNQCLHVASPLDGGAVVSRVAEDGSRLGPAVLCPWHGWAYDLGTGEHLTAFGARDGIRVHPHRVVDGMVTLTLPVPGDEPLRD
jgi:nitrite reductase (NADH) small subunit